MLKSGSFEGPVMFVNVKKEYSAFAVQAVRHYSVGVHIHYAKVSGLIVKMGI